MAGAPMSAADAVAAVERMAATALDPVLTTEEVEAIVAAAKRADADGREIIDDAWAETYDVRWAAAEAWLAKAGKAAGRADLARGGSSIKRSSVHEACLRMARLYRRGVSSALVTREAAIAAAVPLANGPDHLPDEGGAGGVPRTGYLDPGNW
jgi:hypothetical protein